ncbi:MAG: hypothetical protein ACXVCP_15415 [Bdellovibrio sp.]
MKLIVIFILFTYFCYPPTSFASAQTQKVYSGFNKRARVVISEISGPLREVIETDTEFKIVIGLYAAVYRFPKKNKLQTNEIRTLLSDFLKSKKKLRLEVYFASREIFTLSDGESSTQHTAEN